jgi:Tfp pilus assembly protein PilN
MIRPHMEVLKRDLRFSFQYFTTNMEFEPPQTMYISGEGEALRNLYRYLQSDSNIQINPMPVPEDVNCDFLENTAISNLQQLNVRSLLWLPTALQDEHSINLLPLDIKKRKIIQIQKISFRVIGFSVISIFVIAILMLILQARDYQNRIQNAQAHLNVIENIQDYKNKITSYEDLMKKIQLNKVPVEGLLKIFNEIVPEEIMLEDLDFQQSTHSLIINGVVFIDKNVKESILTDFMLSLESSAFIEEASLLSSKKTENSQIFKIGCKTVGD